MWFHKLGYFFDIWNMMDLISLGLNITTLCLWKWDDNQELLNAFASISCLIMWGKMFYFLRIFFATAHLVRMIIEIVYDMRYFILIFFISVFAFANAFYILGRNMDENLAGRTFLLGFIYSYRMGLGDWDTGDFDGRDQWLLYTLWFLNSFIILIVLLNLVIAIMGDSFDRVQERSEQSLLQELTQMMRENEFLFHRNLFFRGAKYIVIIKPETAESGSNVSWEGKINQLKTFLEESSNQHIKDLKDLDNVLDKAFTATVDDKLRRLEERVGNKLSSLDTKFDEVLKKLTKVAHS